MATIHEMTMNGQMGAIASTGAGAGGDGFHPGASTGTIGIALGLLFGINKGDANGFEKQLNGTGIIPSDTKMFTVASKGKEKIGDKLLKNASEGTSKASQGIAIEGIKIAGISGGESFSHSGSGFTPTATPSSGGGGGRNAGGSLEA